MKLKRLLPVLIAAALFTLAGRAAITDSHRAAIEHMFTVLKIDKQYEVAMIEGFEAGTGLNDERLATLPEDQRAKVKASLEKVKAKMVELMGWDKIKPDMVELYAKHFTEADANAIIKLMDSPAGQMLVSRQVAMLPESMALGQKKAQAVMPQIVQLMQEGMK